MNRPLIAADPGKLDTILDEIQRMHRRLDLVEMERRPYWLPLAAYAEHVGRTPRTVRNWIDAGKVDTKREGSVVFVKVS